MSDERRIDLALLMPGPDGLSLYPEERELRDRLLRVKHGERVELRPVDGDVGVRALQQLSNQRIAAMRRLKASQEARQAALEAELDQLRARRPA